MRHYEWINGNHMRIITFLEVFNQQVGAIGHGNVIDNVQYSNFIRSYNTTDTGNGVVREPGVLQAYDLQGFDFPWSSVRNRAFDLTRENGGILYQFHHWTRGDRKIVDGFILTARERPYEVIWKIKTGPTWASGTVLAAAESYISDAGDDRCSHPQDKIMTGQIYSWHDEPRKWDIFCNQCGRVLAYNALVREDYIDAEEEE